LNPILAVIDHHGLVDSAPEQRCSGLLAVLATVPDPRAARGVRHRFAAILAVSVCAVLAGARSFVAIGEWAADLPPSARLRLGLGRRAASESAIRRGLQRLDAAALDTALSKWLGAACRAPDDGMRVIAVDGKTARGARGPDGQIHLLAAFDVGNGVVLGQAQVDGKTNEINAFAPLLDLIDITDALITADALHTQRRHAEYLIGRGAHYLLTVKNNQPTLRRNLAALPWKEVPVGERTIEHDHGRRETRTLKVAEVAAGIAFPGAKLAIRITRTRQPTRGRRHTETVHAITDLNWHQIHPGQIADALRAHWQIENRLHWIRDVTFTEDHSQVRTGNSPAVMATLRNLAISLHRLTGATNIAAACRHVSRHPARAVQLVT
jgi:predicted transposase YbfD/YdcC